MANTAIISGDTRTAIANAIGELVRVREWGAASYITLPLFYPSGATVSIKVAPSHMGFAISDSGLAYRESEQIGGTNYFSKNVRGMCDEGDVWHDSRAILLEVTVGELSAGIADVATASTRIAWKVAHKVQRTGQEEIVAHLFERLQRVFGTSRVEPDVKIVGPSTKNWDVDALVHADGQDVIFQAVANHHAKVYSTAAMFHDLALAEHRYGMVSVVRDKAEMGYQLNILSQAGSVIEETQSDAVYESAVQLQFL